MGAGHEVRWLGKGASGSAGYQDRAELFEILNTLSIDVIVLIQLEDAAMVEHLEIPIIVDLYAQRLLEANFAGQLEQDTLHVLRALRAGDLFLCSNRRQYWSWLGLFSLAGISLDPAPIINLPLMSHPPAERTTPQSPILIGGGIWWPWQNPWDGIARALEEMDRLETGELHWYGAPPNDEEPEIPPEIAHHPRFLHVGIVSLSQFRAALHTASAAFDWMELNPERQLALSFRQLEYLSAGLPIISYPDSPFADMIEEAGWCSWDLEQSIEHALTLPSELRRRSQIALHLAEELRPEKVIVPLLEWLEDAQKRAPTVNPLGDIAEAWSSSEREYQIRLGLEAQLEQAQELLQLKEQEIREKNHTESTLLGAIDRLTLALEHISGFKNEALQITGHRLDSAQRSAEEMSKENAILRADIEKKTAELNAMNLLRERLENDLENIRQELAEQQRRRSIFRR